MKVIDEKGRIFGKLNIIDLLVVILLIALVAALGIKIVRQGDAGVTGTTKLTYTVKVSGVEPEVYQSILKNIPGQLMASGELLDATVVSVKATPCENEASIDTSGGTLDITMRDDLLDLVFTIEANVTNTVTDELGTQEIRIGKSHIVKTTKFELSNGVILSCQWEGQS